MSTLILRQNTMKQNFFAVDLGATSGRTILGTFTENGLELKEINRFSNHLIEMGGHFYWDIYALYRHIIDGLKLVAHSGESIASIGIDTWGHRKLFLPVSLVVKCMQKRVYK